MSSARTTESPSRIAGRYQVLATLGQGAAGAVHRVLDESTGKQFALKQLAPDASARISALFEQEYYTLASLRHPHIVEVYDYGSDEGVPYYTMGLLEGSDLSQLAPLPWPVACEYIRAAAAAVSVLHARKLLHRDISPRNLWRTPSGLIKLIDFGALTAFGNARDVVGTPPMVAPEALSGQLLDPRTDLYALGALLYWLVSGVHAYPARNLRDLPNRWERGFAPASQELARAARADLPPLPAELDALIESLLSKDPRARPGSAGELYERLGVAAGLSEQDVKGGAGPGLPTPALVGRARELSHFQRALKQSAAGAGKVTLVSGERGSGRSRVLAELALEARLRGGAVLFAQADRCHGQHGLGQVLTKQALTVLPEQARRAGLPHADALAPLTEELAGGAASSRTQSVALMAGDGAAQLANAFVSFLSELSRDVPLVILVDDAERLDEDSAALLLALAAAAKEARILLGISLTFDAFTHGSPRIRALRSHAKKLPLAALDGAQTRELLHSLFGDVPHLPRLAEKVQRATQGIPARIVSLAEQMLRLDLVSYVDGTWLLPQELPEALLLQDAGRDLEARLARLTPAARDLAARLSLHEGATTHELVRALSELAPAARVAATRELLDEGILVGDADGFAMPDPQYRRVLREELIPAQIPQLRARLGRHLLTRSDLTSSEELRACVHVLQVGPEPSISARVTELAAQLLFNEPDQLRVAVAPLEEALSVLRAHKLSPYALLRVLSALAVAGFFVDRSLSQRYGEAALKALSDTLGLSLAARLRRFLGRRVALLIGLMVAGFRFAARKKDRHVPPMPEAIRMFFNCNGSLLGIGAICVDQAAIRRSQELLDVWRGLGKKHFTSIIYEIGEAMRITVQDRPADAYARWQHIIERLETPERALGMPEDARIRYLAGALYTRGVLACLREETTALDYAERLDALGPVLYKMSADQIRTVYYGQLGNQSLFEHYRARVELAAVQYGSAWQAEVWGASAGIAQHLRTHDGAGMKQVLEQLRRLSQTIPSQKPIALRCQGAYLLLRRRYAEAASVLEACVLEEPLSLVAWARTHGTLARALNALGQHERALELCQRALGLVAPGDLAFRVTNLSLQIEFALSLSYLGRNEEAAQELDALLIAHRDAGPLSLGALHEARARVALAANQPDKARAQQASMERAYRGTQIATLVARCETFGRELARALDGGSASFDGRRLHGGVALSTETSAADVTALERLLTGTSMSGSVWAENALDLVLGGSAEGAIFRIESRRAVLCAASEAWSLPTAVDDWLRQRVRESNVVAVTETASLEGPLPDDPDQLALNGEHYRLHWLRTSERGQEETLGVLLARSKEPDAPSPRPELLEAVARRLTNSGFSRHASVESS